MKSLFKIIFLLSFVLSISCSQAIPDIILFRNKDGKVYKQVMIPVLWAFDCTFPEDLKSIVRDGFKYWDELTSLQMFEEQQSCGASSKFMVMVLFDEDYFYVSGKVKKETLGAVDLKKIEDVLLGANITFYRSLRENKSGYVRRSAVRHEIGHVLGFAHGGKKECLMYPKIEDDDNLNHDITKNACEKEIRIFKSMYHDEKQN